MFSPHARHLPRTFPGRVALRARETNPKSQIPALPPLRKHHGFLITNFSQGLPWPNFFAAAVASGRKE
jgi:hypothetical protein